MHVSDRDSRRTIKGQREWNPAAPAYRRKPEPMDDDGWLFRTILYATEFLIIAALFFAPFATAIWWMSKH